MKLLIDENLSAKLVIRLAAEFPESTHVKALGLRGAADRAIWEYAKEHGFTIVSKDDDFRQKAFLLGAPPKVVWLALGNSSTAVVATLLKQNRKQLEAFLTDADDSLLVLDL